MEGHVARCLPSAVICRVFFPYLPSAGVCRVFFSRIVECQNVCQMFFSKALGKQKVCRVSNLYRVFLVWHSVKRWFAECPIKYTRQKIWHSANYSIPLVIHKAELYRCYSTQTGNTQWAQKIPTFSPFFSVPASHYAPAPSLTPLHSSSGVAFLSSPFLYVDESAKLAARPAILNWHCSPCRCTRAPRPAQPRFRLRRGRAFGTAFRRG